MKFEGIDDDDIVISGIGCKFPDAENIPELAEKLYGGVDLVTQDERKAGRGIIDAVPEFSGTMRNPRKFDSMFFGIPNVIARSMDPLTRQILERTFEAIIDAGLHPEEIKGKNASVYSGTYMSDSDLVWLTDNRNGYMIMGRNRCMNANRISYWLDLTGTSAALDSTYANGIVNLANAWEAIRNDRCDIALVNSANLQCSPLISIQFNDFGVLSPDGKCKAFDDSANGYARADAVIVLVLQKAKYAKRCYAVVEHAMATCLGDRSQPIHKSVQQDWESMLKEFYTQSKINVNDIYYVEGHGSGIKDEDTAELNALNSVFCKNRTTPLFVGSIKSNFGHSEGSAALSGVVKSIISLDKGIIPQNLHYNTPNEASQALCNGKIKVVDKNIPLPPNALVAVNAHSVGGVFGHSVFRANPKKKSVEYDGVPRLVLLADRTDDQMVDLLTKVESSPFDLQFISLMQEVYAKKIYCYLSRGYTILPKINDVSVYDHQVYSAEKRPVWFIFSGMGSQWPKMGKRLMDLPLFRESIERSHKILEKKGLNLIDIITNDDPTIFDNILHSFVGIAAVQIALVDILTALGIVPAGMIGHSVGELGCAYADGCFTAEQMILSAYSRGMASIETPLIKGFMAAIGKGYNQIKDELPEGIEVACRNAKDSCTISGPAELVKNYVKELQDRKIFARTVNVSNIAYHSRYIKPAAPKLLEYLKEVIPNPKMRSGKWISTSNLEENWDTDLSTYSSAEYHTNNLLSAVLFEEGCRHIPENAICIEIAPHGLLQAILKRSLSERCVNVPLTNRTAEDPLIFLLQAIGKLYMAGVEPQIKNLYPKIEYPVSRGTSSLHQLVHWQHEHDMHIPGEGNEKSAKYSLKANFFKTAIDGVGYLINESNFYPTSAFLILVWKIFASIQRKKVEECPVIFENIRVEKQLRITDSDSDDVKVFITRGTGLFEVYTDELDQLVRGNIVNMVKEQPFKSFEKDPISVSMSSNEIYDEFQRRGYRIGDQLKILNSVDTTENVWIGKISPSTDWIQTFESMIQLQLLQKGEASRKTLLPLSIGQLSIAPQLHADYKESAEKSNSLEIKYHVISNVAQLGGLEMKGLQLQEEPNASPALKFESVQFLTFSNPKLRDVWRFVDFCFRIVADNFHSKSINILELNREAHATSIGAYLKEEFPHLKLNVATATMDAALKPETKDLVICDDSSLKESFRVINKKGFVFLRTEGNANVIIPNDIDVISKLSVTNNEEFMLLKKKEILKDDVDFILIPKNELMLKELLKTLAKTKRVSYLIGYNDPEEGFDNYKRRLQAETSAELRWILILDKNAPSFDSKSPFFSNQLKKGLITNAYRDGTWGSFYHRIFNEKNSDFSLGKLGGELTPAFVGINFDADLIPSKQMEYSGTLKNGYKIMGITSVENNKKIVPDTHLTWKVPKTWSMEDAATCTSSYATAYYCIKIVGDIKPYESVLVTDALTTIGRAAITVALSFNVRVFATVNSEDEILTLRKLYPTLNEKDIILHKDNHFDIELGLLTEGLYPEIVINSLEGSKLYQVINCFASYGRIFHFGKEDLKENNDLGLSVFLLSTAFHAVEPEILTHLRNNEKEEVRKFISDGLDEGILKPLPRIVSSLKDIESGKIHNEIRANRKKIILTGKSFRRDIDEIQIDSKNAYIIIGDETEIWLDLAEWLTGKGVSNLVINLPDTINCSTFSRRYKMITSSSNVIIRKDAGIADLIYEANRLGDVAAVFVIAMEGAYNLTTIAELDKRYRTPNGHLFVISKRKDEISNICTARTKSGYLSTNFIWDTDKMLICKNLNFMEKLCGKEPVIHVSDKKVTMNLSQKVNRMLTDVLPSSIEDYCELGISLIKDVRLIELPTKGPRSSAVKEMPPIIAISGLESDPKTALIPLARKLMYPMVCLQLPHLNLSIKEMATLALPKILSLNKKGRAFNILGVSWGSYVAIELTRLLEELGLNVGLILIDGPLESLKEAFLINNLLESSLFNSIQGVSKKILHERSNRESFLERLDDILSLLDLPLDKENEFKEAVSYIHHCLNAMVNYGRFNFRLKGPMTIIKSGEKFKDDGTRKICSNVMIRNVGGNAKDVFNSTETILMIHGSAISDSMSDNTIHRCTWKDLEDFFAEEKETDITHRNILKEIENSEGHTPLHMRFSFGDIQCYDKN